MPKDNRGNCLKQFNLTLISSLSTKSYATPV